MLSVSVIIDEGEIKGVGLWLAGSASVNIRSPPRINQCKRGNADCDEYVAETSGEPPLLDSFFFAQNEIDARGQHRNTADNDEGIYRAQNINQFFSMSDKEG